MDLDKYAIDGHNNLSAEGFEPWHPARLIFKAAAPSERSEHVMTSSDIDGCRIDVM